MSWLTPTVREFGHLEPGARGFGSLHLDSRSPIDDRLIVLHNLGSFWNRPFIGGRSFGFPQPLSPPALFDGPLSRIPGHVRFDIPDVQLQDRNQLAAIKREDCVKLWCVNELSDRKVLERMEIRVNKKGEARYVEGSREKVHTLLDGCLQLKSGRIVELFVRRRSGLDILMNNDVRQIFRGSVTTFDENPWLDDVLVCDRRGFVWNGPIDTSLARIKNFSGHTTKRTCYSNHPRIAFSCNDDHVRLLDLRSDTGATTLSLYTLSDVARREDYERDIIPLDEFTKPHIAHLHSVYVDERFCLVITNRDIIMIDSRKPGSSVFQIGHGLDFGAHHIVPSRPLIDPIEGGLICNYHFLSHLPASLSSFTLYKHTSGLWSTVAPMRRRTDLTDYCKLLKEEEAGGKEREKLLRPTVAIALADGYRDKKERKVEIMFRCLEDGSIWSESIIHGEVDIEESNEKVEKNNQRVSKYVRENVEKAPVWVSKIPGRHCESVKKGCKLVDFEMDVDEQTMLSWEKNVKGMKMKRRKRMDILEPVKEVDNKDKELSGLVNHIYNKYCISYEDAVIQSKTDRPLMLQFDDDDDDL